MNMSSSIPVPQGRVAVLVDGENISCQVADEVLQRVTRIGEPVVRRVYGNACIIGHWEGQPGFNFIHTGSGKNSADMKLVVDAVELSYSENIDRFVIVTSDGDFTHLVYALRERGLYVFGLGEAKAPEKYKNACTRFIELKIAPKQATTNPEVDDLTIPEIPAVEKPPFDVKKVRFGGLTHKLILAIEKEGPGGIAISSINKIMRGSGIKISDYAEKKWRPYLIGRPGVFICDPRGPNARVRLIKGVATTRPVELAKP